MDVAIRIEHLSKRYRIAEAGARPDSLQAAIAERLRSLASGRWRAGTRTEPLWALRDLSFDIRRGAVTSIIGRNGAGKSTLLRVLSRITEPTSGRAEIYGQVASVLEVGTGFQGELTGRENIYLNAAILGMRRAEIQRRFDEIVAFAEIDRFVDTPVKRYSSGMWVRLAFAVAAHLDPEILFVDEALAVGDVAFQKKCLGKMEDYAREGRTVVFVSHDLAAVASLSEHAVLLEQGQLTCLGPTRDVLDIYCKGFVLETPRGERRLDPPPNVPLVVTGVRTSDAGGRITSQVSRLDPIVFTVDAELRTLCHGGDTYFLAVDVRSVDDHFLFRTHADPGVIPGAGGPFSVSCSVPAGLLPPATYRAGVVTGITGRAELQHVYPVLEFEVVRDPADELDVGPPSLLTPRCDWRLVVGRAA